MCDLDSFGFGLDGFHATYEESGPEKGRLMAEVVPHNAPGLSPGVLRPRAPGPGGMPGSPAGLRYGLNMLVDQHSYGILHADLGLGTFETHLAAAERGSAVTGATDEDHGGGGVPRSGSFFDGPTGLAVRHWCPPLLGLEAHCSPARYLARRRELGAYTAGRALLRGSGISCFLFESGDPREPWPCSDVHGLSSAVELAAAAAGLVRERVSLEVLAGQVADTSGSVRAFVRNAAEALHAAAPGAVAFTCVARFREEQPPGLHEVQRAAERWLRARAGQRPGTVSAGVSGGDPLGQDGCAVQAEPVLVRHLLWSAFVTRRPVQLLCGDPAPLAGFLRSVRGLGTDVVLLTQRPHHRVAARLAAAHPHVYADVGPCPAETLAEAPFGKLLFSSGARALPELYVVRARTFVREMQKLLAQWVVDGGCTDADAARIARQISRGTARRVYGLEDATAG